MIEIKEFKFCNKKIFLEGNETSRCDMSHAQRFKRFLEKIKKSKLYPRKQKDAQANKE